jgi:hypothetical protein
LYMSCTSLNSKMSFCTAPAMSSSLRQRRHGKGKDVSTVWVGRAVRGMRLCCCTFYTRISRGQQWVRSRSACTVHLNSAKLNLSCHSGCARRQHDERHAQLAQQALQALQEHSTAQPINARHGTASIHIAAQHSGMPASHASRAR